MPGIEEYAKQAAREVGRYYGRILDWDRDLARERVPSCEEWFLRHWRRFPATEPTAGRIIEGEAVAIVGFLE
jgi:hypothetical protein